MTKQLILAEKPSVARDISRVLEVKEKHKGYFESKNRIVTWALGHLVTLSTPEEYNKKYQKWNMEDLPIMPEEMRLSVIKSSRDQFNTVKSLLNRKDVDEIVIATDAGREGELVARLILKYSGCHKKMKRLWISSVTDKAIKDGFNNLKDAKEYNNLYKSAMARAEADWIVGINGSRCLTLKYNTPLSCGRVQTPTLNIINQREEEIRNFVPKDYYGILLKTDTMEFKWIDNRNSISTPNEEKIDNILGKIKGQKLEIINIETTEKKKYPQELYDLTNLQKDANQRYNFSAKETLSIMQDLYEKHKILTYPRTDSRYITEDIVPTLKERLRAMAAGNYREYANRILSGKIKADKSFVDNKKVSDHHAIIPTEQKLNLALLDDKEIKIYDLVAKRFLSILMEPYIYEEVKITAKIGDEKFIAKGKRDKSLGFKEIDSYEEDEDNENQKIYKLEKGDKLKVNSFKKTSKKTSPPARFNEGSLLLAMENPVKYDKEMNKEQKNTLKETGGIGTVATRGDIIEKLYSSDLIENTDNRIKITSKGIQLLQLVPEKLKSPELTADWELKLREIEKGKLKDKIFLKEIREFSKENIEEIKKSNYKFRHENMTGSICPQCGKHLLIVNRKDKEMLICEDYECNYRKVVSMLTNVRCPQCKKKMKLVTSGEKKNFICDNCGYRESKENMDKKFKANKNKMSKSEVKNYIKKQDQNDESVNTGLFDALKGLKL